MKKISLLLVMSTFAFAWFIDFGGSLTRSGFHLSGMTARAGGPTSGQNQQAVGSQTPGDPRQKGRVAQNEVRSSKPQATQSPKSNRLIKEKSPYLLEHAYNPVDWYPWGEEAFALARREDKPIFLSVGYSTCHWCHVMERESFSDEEIAGILNRHFVAIKVDREERPDVDQVYMTFVQVATGGGGWPMSVFLTPELKPFLGGTYFPPRAARGRPGFKELLLQVAEQWKANRERILTSASEILSALDRMSKTETGNLELDRELFEKTFAWYQNNFDSDFGGFGTAPKFPRPVSLRFLLRYYAHSGDKHAREMVVRTLEKMAAGGIRDHLGGGFHRYSTDRSWFLPHFEKMLYDQAQLAVAFLEAFQLTRDQTFADVAGEVLDYVLRDLTSREGAFYSAEDADSPPPGNPDVLHKVEGAFYVWQTEDVTRALGKDAPLFNYFYGVQAGGNVPLDPFQEFTLKNVLSKVKSVEETAERFQLSPEQVKSVLSRGKATLLRVRAARPHPFRDDKVLTAWNGLMISAFSKGFQVLRDPRFLKAAERAALFLEDRLYNRETGLLYRRYRLGDSAVDGMLEDYAFLVQGLLDLYESDLDDKWLRLAYGLTETQLGRFWDPEQGGFFRTSGGDKSVLLRVKGSYDGAEPAANSVAAENLFRLSEIFGRNDWAEKAVATIKAFSTQLGRQPQGMPLMVSTLDYHLGKPKQIVIAGDRQSSNTQAILAEVHKTYLPIRVIILADGGSFHRQLAKRLGFLENVSRIDGKSTAYVCENFVCNLPTNDPSVVARLLKK